MNNRNETNNPALLLIGVIALPWLYPVGERLAIKAKRKITEQRLKKHKKSVQEIAQELMEDIADIVYSTEKPTIADIERVELNAAFLNIIKEL